GHSSGRAANVLQSRRRIHGRNRYYTNINRKTLALREPSIHGPSPLAKADLPGSGGRTIDVLRRQGCGA
ncbi:hypothetical protein KY389_15065, partial [Paracoccus bogoriensis]|uniref:hypothetical protein n=1 Tax=Paracoccus bogoriensis TaxID=242065 RepID=UPI001CA54457